MTSREPRDPYRVLGVRREASAAEIVRAFRRAARATHPDAGGAGAGRFQAVSDAYDVLRDPGRRLGYDRRHPVPPQQVADAGGSVRYAAPGSQHVVLGPRPTSAIALAGEMGVPTLPGLSDVEEIFRVAFLLLRGNR